MMLEGLVEVWRLFFVRLVVRLIVVALSVSFFSGCTKSSGVSEFLLHFSSLLSFG